MYYKIVSEGQIIDVCDGLNFVRWQKRIGAFLACESEDGATGILTSDGSGIYLLESAERRDGMKSVAYAEIDEETYAALRMELIANGVLEDVERPGENAGDDGGVQEVVAKGALLSRIEALEARNEVLLECILEMSEVVYGE